MFTLLLAWFRAPLPCVADDIDDHGPLIIVCPDVDTCLEEFGPFDEDEFWSDAGSVNETELFYGGSGYVEITIFNSSKIRRPMVPNAEDVTEYSMIDWDFYACIYESDRPGYHKRKGKWNDYIKRAEFVPRFNYSLVPGTPAFVNISFEAPVFPKYERIDTRMIFLDGYRSPTTRYNTTADRAHYMVPICRHQKIYVTLTYTFKGSIFYGKDFWVKDLHPQHVQPLNISRVELLPGPTSNGVLYIEWQVRHPEGVSMPTFEVRVLPVYYGKIHPVKYLMFTNNTWAHIDVVDELPGYFGAVVEILAPGYDICNDTIRKESAVYNIPPLQKPPPSVMAEPPINHPIFYVSLNKLLRTITVNFYAHFNRRVSAMKERVYISIVKKPPTIEVYSSAVEDTASGFVFKVDDDGGSYEVRMNSSLRKHDYVAKGPFIFERFDILTSATVAELEYTIVRTAVLVTWDLVAERYVDELESYVEVRNADKELKSFTTRDYALDLVLDHRPTTYEVKVCTWYVNRTGHCSETGVIAVPELAPEDPPEKIGVNVSETGAISVDFLPPRANKLIGTLLRCTVALCTGRVVTSECLTKTVPITSTHRLSVQFDDPESANVLYASAECYTNGGASPRSVRVPIYTGKEDEREKLRKQQQKDFKINISISVDGGTRSIVRWRMSMGNDAKPPDDLIKEFKILRYRRLNSKYRPQYVPGKVLTTDRSLNEFDDGISPAYKLESRCYWYAVEITLKNGTRVVQKTDEICYSVASPGYLMFFAAEIVCIVVSWFCICNPTKDSRAASQRPVVTSRISAKSASSSSLASTSDTSKTSTIRSDTAAKSSSSAASTPDTSKTGPIPSKTPMKSSAK